MANLVLKSERQIQTEFLSTLIAELGLNDVNPGSVVDVISQAFAQQTFALYYQIAQISRLVDLEAITGDDLDLKAFEYGIQRRAAQKAKGNISILRPSGFVKVSTTFYAGSPPAITGDTQIDVNDASNALIASSGQLIIGRGTLNEEQVSYAVAPTNFGNYWRFILTTPLTKDHALEETIILKQGNDEVILAGTVVVVPATGVSEEIQFTIDNDTTLLAGEDRVDGVEVTASQAGTDGNIPIGAIDGEAAFSTPPFTGARANNGQKFTTGRDRETDDELRDRIRSQIQSLSKSVKQAILNAIVGLVDPATAKRVVSASVVLPVDDAGPVKVYIDDGTGFEPSFLSRGFETLLSSSTGGEERLQLNDFPISKAQIENNAAEPYDMSSGPLTLIYTIGTRSETITFNPGEFRFPDIASSEEVVALINDKATLIEARTSQIGKKIVINAKADINENIQVTGGTSNSILSFPTDRKDTVNLYIDDILKSKDGETAVLDSGNNAPFDLLNIGAYPHTLTVVVDGKTANVQTATINLVDVDDPSAVVVSEIAAVINRDIAGVTAFGVNNNTRLRIESNTKLSSASKVKINGGSANDAVDGLNFSTTQVSGIDGDYTFNRELGIVQLKAPLGVNQSVTLGSQFTRGKQRAASAELYSPATGQTLVISVDGGANQTVTFDASFAGGKTAEDTATFINAQLFGATAVVREIGSLNYVEIRTNTYDPLIGSIEVKGTSTANTAFSFTLDVENQSAKSNKALQVSGNSSPFDFAEADSLVVVLDSDIVNSAFAIPMNYSGVVTSSVSTTVFRNSAFNTVFLTSNILNNFYVAFTAGPNTTTGDIDEVQDMGGGIARYTYIAAPPNFGDYPAGSLVKITDFTDPENNGNFVVVAVGVDWVEVENADAINATGEAATGLLSQRRQVTAYNQLNGQITVGSAFTNSPVVGNPFVVIPSTVTNLVNFINNTKVTSFTLKGIVEGADNNTKLQLSSKQEGSDGYVQVTGGRANLQLNFPTTVYRGIAAYNYWTGLLDLVHKTIYGDDTDLLSFPGVGAAGITFQILAPTVVELDIELDVTLQEGISIASIENEVKSAVTSYINALGVGEDVIIERIRASVIAVSGVIDVTISNPTVNIAIADNELARVKDSNILIG